MKRCLGWKVWSNPNYRLEHEGYVCTVDVAEWRNDERAELRVYGIHGDVTTDLLREALELLCNERALNHIVSKSTLPRFYLKGQEQCQTVQ